MFKTKTNTIRSACTLLASVGCAYSGSAYSQAQQPASPSSGWTVNIGAAVVAGPRFPGASDRKVSIFPVTEARYKDYIFISPLRGIGSEIKLAEGLKVSAALGIDLTSRKQKDSPRLVGLGDVDDTGALLLGADYQLGDAFVKAGLSSRFGSENQRGTSFNADLGYKLYKTSSIVLSAGLNARAMDNTYARNVFGVTPQQSSASTLPTFKASGGLQSAGAFAEAFYRIDTQWSAFSRLNLYQLQGDAADSPIVQQKGQTTFVLGVTRAF